jgi:hypothetical protein
MKIYEMQYWQTARVSLALAIAIITTPAGAVDSRWTYGGQGGNPFRIECGQDRFLVGLTGRAGDWIDQVAPICTTVYGTRWAETPTTEQAVGGRGGGPFTTMCPKDTVVSAVGGLAGDFVVSIELNCKVPGSSNSVSAQPEKVGGGKTSSTRGSFCSGNEDLNGELANGIFGRAGAYVDQLGLTCGTVRTPVPHPLKKPPRKPIETEPVEKGAKNYPKGPREP